MQVSAMIRAMLGNFTPTACGGCIQRRMRWGAVVLVPTRGSKSPDEGHSSGNGREKQGSTLQGRISPFGSIQEQSSCVPHRPDVMES